MKKLIEFLALIIVLDPSIFNEYLLRLFSLFSSIDFNDFSQFVGLTPFTCFYSTNVSKVKVKVEDNEKFLRDGYLIEEAAKETKIKVKVKEGTKEKIKEGTKEKIIINNLVFNKLNDEL
jgi:hypothetical protein